MTDSLPSPGRRRLLTSGVAALGALALGHVSGFDRRSWAQTPSDARLERRLELWSNYAAKTENLTARYTSTRTSSLLHEPLVHTGALAFASPGVLVLADDAMDGAVTRIGEGRVSIVPRADMGDPDDDRPPDDGRIDPRAAPGLLWLRDRLLGCFDGRSDRGLAVGCDAHAPRGRRPRIELRPPEGSAVRKLMRVVVVQLDPVGGAVVHIQIDEAGGDRFELALADHRQNVDQAEIDRIVGER